MLYCLQGHDECALSPSIHTDLFWLSNYKKKLDLYFKYGTFFVADYVCQGWERRQNILFMKATKRNVILS